MSLEAPSCQSNGVMGTIGKEVENVGVEFTGDSESHGCLQRGRWEMKSERAVSP